METLYLLTGEPPTIGQLALQRAPKCFMYLWRKKFKDKPAMYFVRYPSEATRNVDFIVEELHRQGT
jgi:hypothetical protein